MQYNTKNSSVAASGNTGVMSLTNFSRWSWKVYFKICFDNRNGLFLTFSGLWIRLNSWRGLWISQTCFNNPYCYSYCTRTIAVSMYSFPVLVMAFLIPPANLNIKLNFSEQRMWLGNLFFGKKQEKKIRSVRNILESKYWYCLQMF